MKHILLALPLAGMMMTASLAYAQSSPPATVEPAPAGQGEATPQSTDCVDLSDGAAASQTPQEMAAGLNAPADQTADQAASQATAPQQADAASETQPVAGPDAGTAPGGSGSSAWTGGLGGSDIGTSQSEPLDSSPQRDHPAVASGLDPISGETAVEGPQAPPELDENAAMAPAATSGSDSAARTGC